MDDLTAKLSDHKATNGDARSISEALLAARRLDTPLAEFPGATPTSLEEAYAIQALSIDAWPDEVKGWKVGGVAPSFQADFNAARLAGPIFSRTIRQSPASGEIEVPAYKGFVAVEAEWVFELGDCSGLPDANLSEEDAVSAIKAAYIGVEIASSPIVDINSYGPAIVVSDFGNNHGLILGPAIEDWSNQALSGVSAEVSIDGEIVGQASALPGLDGPIGAVAFLIEHLKARGVGDLSGLLVSSGAITGVHDSKLGASSVVTFEGIGEIALKIAPIS